MNEFYFYRFLEINCIDKYRKLNNGYLGEFLNNNEVFKLALSLSYMALSKEAIIDKNVKIPDPEKRITSSVELEQLDYLLTEEFSETPPKIYESTGTSSRWIIDSLRDSLLHGQFTIDFEKKEFNINNQSENRKLVCDVPFSWFTDYFNHHIVEHKKVKEVNTTGVFLNSDSFNMMRHCNNRKDIENYIDKLVTYKINIKSNDLVNEREIKRFIDQFINDESSNLILKNNLHYLDYNEKWEFTKKTLDAALKEKYPNIKVKITKVKDENIAEKLDNLYNTKNNNIYEIDDYRIQYSLLKNRLKQYYSATNTSILDCLETLNSSLQIYEKEIKNNPQYGECKDVINYILNSNNDGGKTLEYIHKYRKEKKLPNSYDENIIGDYRNVPLDEEDRKGISDFLKNKYSYETNNVRIRLKELKEYDEKLYHKYNKKFEEKDYISEEDISFYRKKIIKIAEQLRSKTANEKELLELAITYALGISTYVINKEKVFDKMEYDKVDVKNIEAYSASFYKVHSLMLDEANEQYKNITRKIKELEEDQNIGEKKKNNIIAKYNKKLNKCEQKLKKLNEEEKNVKIFNGKKYKKVDKEYSARMIRNCLSHLDRINFTSYDKGQLILDDETGFVKCSIDDLYMFIANDAFHNAMREYHDINEMPRIFISAKNLINQYSVQVLDNYNIIGKVENSNDKKPTKH